MLRTTCSPVRSPSRTVHGIRTAWLLIVMPRSRSMSMRSRYCARISLGSTTSVSCSMRSASVDLPWSMCAMMQKLRMRAGSVAPGPSFGGTVVRSRRVVFPLWSHAPRPGSWTHARDPAAGRPVRRDRGPAGLARPARRPAGGHRRTAGSLAPVLAAWASAGAALAEPPRALLDVGLPALSDLLRADLSWWQEILAGRYPLPPGAAVARDHIRELAALEAALPSLVAVVPGAAGP